MIKLAIAVAALALPAGLAGWDYASPSWALSGLMEAVVRRDTPSAAAYIDFPALRENLKRGFRARYVGNALAPTGIGLGALSDQRGFVAISRLVDSTVTPAGLDLLFAKVAQEPDTNQGAGHTSPDHNLRDALVIHRTGWNQFEAVVPSGYPLGLIFTREGFTWKVTNVRLPADLAKAFARTDQHSTD